MGFQSTTSHRTGASPDLWAIRRQLDDLAAYAKAIYIENEYGDLTLHQFKSKLDLRTGRHEAKTAEGQSVSFKDFLDIELAEMR